MISASIASALERSRKKSIALGSSAFLLVAVLDMLTPEPYSFSLFYLVSISVFSWFVGRGWAWYIAAASAFLWAFNHLARGDLYYFSRAVSYWEAASRFGFYAVFILALQIIKRYLGQLRSINDELRAALTARQESEHRYREVFDYSSGGIMLLDVVPGQRFTVVTVNPAVERMAGVAASAVVGRYLEEVLPPETAGQLNDAYWRCVQAGSPTTVDGLVRLPSGRRTIRTTLIPVRDSNGRIHRLIALPVDMTDTIRAGEARRESEQRYREVFENTSDGIFVIDVTPERRFRVVTFNPAMEKMVGLKNEDVAGRYNEEFLRPETAASVMENNERCLREGKPISFEEQLDLPRGLITWNTTLVPVRDAGGRIYRIVGVARDITETVGIRRALQQSEEKFSTAFHASPDSIVISRLADGVILEVNQGFTELNGYSREEAVGRSAMPGDLGIWDDAADRARFAALVREEGGLQGFEGKLRRKDGALRYSLLSARKVVIDGQECILTITRDVTDRRRMEAALRESEARFREIFENSSEGIFLHEVTEGPRYRLLSVNPAMERMIGITAAEAVGRFNDEYLPREIAEKANEDHRRCLEAGRPISFEADFNLPIGHSYFSTTLVPVRDETGRIARLIGVARDDTERKLAEEREREHERQIFQAAKLSSLGTLVAGIAHEINNPNNYIRLNSQNLKELWQDIRWILDQAAAAGGGLEIHGIPYEAARTMVEDLLSGIGEGSKRIEKLLVNLRDFARGEEGDLTESVDVNAVIDSAVMITRELIQKSTLAFTVVPAPGLPPIRGSYHQIEQVVINLLTNACQALPSRDRKITVTTLLEEGGERVLLEVADEGVGMPLHFISRITDPFFTTKRARGGSGLGLAVSSRIVSNHKGIISFDSEVEKGTRVTVLLPVSREMK